MSNYLTLAEAARLAPGRPSANAVWRWCRKGVKSRNGETIRLTHVRAGRQIFTTSDWMDEFFAVQARADLEGLRPDRLQLAPRPKQHVNHGPEEARQYLRRQGF